MVGKDTIRIESSDSNTDVRGDEGLGFIIDLLIKPIVFVVVVQDSFYFSIVPG
jgi:hypothetical protein